MHAILFLAAALFAQDIFTVHTFHQVAISPDGKRVAWAEDHHGIWTANVDGSNKHPWTKADDQGIAWSPDSRSLAYLAEKNGQKQLYIGAKQLTDLKGFLAEPAWS